MWVVVRHFIFLVRKEKKVVREIKQQQHRLAVPWMRVHLSRFEGMEWEENGEKKKQPENGCVAPGYRIANRHPNRHTHKRWNAKRPGWNVNADAHIVRLALHSLKWWTIVVSDWDWSVRLVCVRAVSLCAKRTEDKQNRNLFERVFHAFKTIWSFLFGPGIASVCGMPIHSIQFNPYETRPICLSHTVSIPFPTALFTIK